MQWPYLTRHYVHRQIHPISPGTDLFLSSVSSLTIGLVVGLVGLLVITVTVLVIVIVLSVVLVKQCKSATFTKHDAPPQTPTLPERVQLRENEAYGKVSSDTSPPQVSTTPLRPNFAYGVIQTHQGSRD